MDYHGVIYSPLLYRQTLSPGAVEDQDDQCLETEEMTVAVRQ